MRGDLRKWVAALLVVFAITGLLAAQTDSAAGRLAIRRGNEKFAKQQYEAALKQYQLVPESAGENYAQALYNIGVCHYELWRTDEAVKYYHMAIVAREGRYPKAWYALGIALEDSDRFGAAKEAYQHIVDDSNDMFSSPLITGWVC